jgi:hypothetical protein
MNNFGMDISQSDRALVVAEQRLDAIRKLHFRFYSPVLGDACRTCHLQWPCPTVAILDSDDTTGAQA